MKTDKDLLRLIGAGSNTPPHVACRCFAADLRRVYDAGKEEAEELRQQLAERDKQVALLRDALTKERDLRVFGQTEECGKTHWESIRDMRRDVYKGTEEALAATGQAMSRYILCEREPIAWKCEQEHFDSMGGISTEYMSHKIECVDRSHWVPLYAATAPKEKGK